ncbi:MAG TPA: MauE/DoxX family redox-associated membrane protein [Tepidisphaeraceae bacterium]|nr:MauE/DoxX family redox-associated membrane protein [Tepidisphaeraceae bacterium]
MLPRSGFALRLALAAILLWAALSKFHAETTPAAIASVYDQWLPQSSQRFIWIALESALAVWLLSGIHRRGSALALLILLSIFSGLIAAELTRDHPMPCGCMGAAFVAAHDPAAIRRSLCFSLARNVLMMSAAGWLYLLSWQLTTDNWQLHPTPPAYPPSPRR